MNLLRPLLLGIGLLAASVPARAESPGLEAIKEFREGQSRPGAIENRFFLKGGRFEVAPVAGYVPNNPFATRYVGGLSVGYHFTEVFAAEGTLGYSPDLGVSDLKGLTNTLVQIAQTGTAADSEFVQPLDKITLSAVFAARFSPFYGKINLFGETVLNFDFYGTAGLGMLSKTNYHAIANDDFDPADPSTTPALLTELENEVKITPALGIGSNFFINQTVALKLDARMQLYVDDVPDYQPTERNDTDGQQRLYNNFVTSAGLAFYFPKMKPRLYNF